MITDWGKTNPELRYVFFDIKYDHTKNTQVRISLMLDGKDFSSYLNEFYKK
jgi:hypothetical protein